jgi:hypothetical protein
MTDAPDSPVPPSARTRWFPVVIWIATGLLLASYLAFSLGYLERGWPFFLCQFVGQVALTFVSITKRAWQPAVVNFIFAIASVLGMIILATAAA